MKIVSARDAVATPEVFREIPSSQLLLKIPARTHIHVAFNGIRVLEMFYGQVKKDAYPRPLLTVNGLEGNSVTSV